MTLIIGLKWIFKEGEASLVTSDSRVTTSLGLTYEMKKVYPIQLDEKPVAIAGVAGDTSLAKQGYEIAEEVLLKYAKEEHPVTSATFKTAVRDVESRLVSRLSELRRYSIEPSFQMLLGSVDLDGKSSLYMFDSRGLSEPVHDNPGYGIIGSGMITGGILLLRMMGYDPELELGLLSAFIIDAVSEVDSSVGSFIGDSYLMRPEVKDGERSIALGPLRDEALISYKQQIRARREILKKLWRLCDTYGEERVNESLKEPENASQSIENSQERSI